MTFEDEERYRLKERIAIISESLCGAENRIRQLEENQRVLIEAFRAEDKAHNELLNIIRKMEIPFE